jgi:hypothetical protein
LESAAAVVSCEFNDVFGIQVGDIAGEQNARRGTVGRDAFLKRATAECLVGVHNRRELFAFGFD